MAEMREAIEQGKFADWQEQFHENRGRGVDWVVEKVAWKQPELIWNDEPSIKNLSDFLSFK